MGLPSDERVVFSVSFESMFIRGISPLPVELEAALRELKVDVKKLQAAYPVKVWKDALAAARRTLHPELSDAEAYEQLGRAFIRSYFETLIGRAIKQVLRALGTTRSLERMRQNFRGGNNFFDSTLEKTGERAYRFAINDDLGHPSFVLGIIQEGMTVAVEPTFRMSLVEHTPPAAAYTCSWG